MVNKIIALTLCILLIGLNIEIVKAFSKQEENNDESAIYYIWDSEGFIIGKIKDMEITQDGQINYTAILVLFIGWFYFEHTPRDFVIDFQHRYSLSDFEVDNFKGKVTENFIFGYGNVTT
jgi:hypothetical protein